MSEVRFQRCSSFVLGPAIEGGWSDHPKDKGGPTMRGVTERTFREAIARGVIPPDTKHRELTLEQARAIFRAFYWTPPRCDDFPPPLDLLLFDGYINHRPGPAVELMQRALQVDDDGIVGRGTVAAAQQHPRRSLAVARYITVRENFYDAILREDPGQVAFIYGWKNRLVALHREAMKDLAA